MNLPDPTAQLQDSSRPLFANRTGLTAFGELAMDRRFEQITVAHIVEKADVARAWLYGELPSPVEALAANLARTSRAAARTGDQQDHR